MDSSREEVADLPWPLRAFPSAVWVAAVAVAVTAGSLGHSFTYDDRAIIVENERVRDPARFLDVLTTNYWGASWNAGLYRPVTMATYALQHAVHGLAPLGYHLVNVSLHAAASVLLLVAARRALRRAGVALVAAAVFAAHPVHVEAVAGVVGRAELLAAVGVFGALLLASPRAAADPSPLRAVGALLVLALALGSKESAAVFVAWYAAWRFFDGRWGRGTIVFAAAACAVTLGFVAAKLAVTGTLGVPAASIPFVNNPLAHVGTSERVATSLALLARGVGLLVWPATLRHDYSHAQVPLADGFSDPGVVVGAVVLASALAVPAGIAAARLRRSATAPGQAGKRAGAMAAAVGGVWFVSSWLPTSNLVVPIGTIFAERLLYLPSAGFVLLAFGAVDRWWRVPASFSVAVAAVAVAALGWRAIERTAVWKDDRTLYEDGVRTSPSSARTHLELGKLLYNRSLEAAGADKRELEDRAFAELEAGMDIVSDADPVASLARALLLEGRYRDEEALEEFRRSLSIEPSARARLGELRVLGRLGRRSEMIELAEGWLDSLSDEPSVADPASFDAPFLDVTFLDAVADTLAAFGASELSRRFRERAARRERDLDRQHSEAGPGARSGAHDG